MNHSSAMLLHFDAEALRAVALKCPREFTAREWAQATGRDSRAIRRHVEAGPIVQARRGDWRLNPPIVPLWRLSDEVADRLKSLEEVEA